MTRPATALELAEAHLAGAYRDDDEFPRLFSCRKCGATFHVDFELEPSTFCNTCAHEALDVVAAELLSLTERLRIAESTRDAAQVTSNHELQTRRDAEAQWNKEAERHERDAKSHYEEREKLRELVRTLLASAVPNQREHPTMYAAWTKAKLYFERGY